MDEQQDNNYTDTFVQAQFWLESNAVQFQSHGLWANEAALVM